MKDIIKNKIFEARDAFKDEWISKNSKNILENCYAIGTKLEIYEFLILYIETCDVNKMYALYNKDIQKIVECIFQKYLDTDDESYKMYREILEDAAF